MVGWISFSVIVGVVTGLGGQASGLAWTFVYLFGVLFYFSLPIAVVAEIVRWYRRRKHVKAPEAEPSRLGPARPAV